MWYGRGVTRVSVDRTVEQQERIRELRLLTGTEQTFEDRGLRTHTVPWLVWRVHVAVTLVTLFHARQVGVAASTHSWVR